MQAQSSIEAYNELELDSQKEFTGGLALRLGVRV